MAMRAGSFEDLWRASLTIGVFTTYDDDLDTSNRRTRRRPAQRSSSTRLFPANGAASLIDCAGGL